MTLTITDVEELLKHFTYKPNWRIRVANSEPWDGRVAVLLEMWVLDSRQKYPPLLGVQSVAMHGMDIYDEPGRAAYTLEPRPVGRTCLMPYLDDEEQFWFWLRASITSLERHETDEWFQVDGKLMFDPHKNDFKGTSAAATSTLTTGLSNGTSS